MGLCGLLLVAAATPLNARDAALPPGADFQAGFQGATSSHHREKRGLLSLLKDPWLLSVPGSRLAKSYSPRTKEKYGFYNGYFYTPKARKRILGDTLGELPPDERIALAVADQIIKFGATIKDKSGFQMKYIREKGQVLLQTPKVGSRLPTVLMILPPKRIS